LEKISSERLVVQRDHEEFTQTIMKSTNELIDLREIISRTENDHKSVYETLDVLRSDIGNLKISIESIEASLKGATELSEMIHREKNGHAEELKRLIADREQAKNEVKQLAANEECKLNEKAELSSKEEKISDSIKKLMLEKDEIEQQLAGFIDKLSGSTAKLSLFQNEQAKMDAKKDRYVVDVDDLKNRLWEDHEITYDNAQSFRLEIDNPQPIQKRLIELKNELKEIGPVNMNAIEEYQKVNDRFTFMSEQKEDIETAKANLLGVITDLAVEMRQQFVSHFEQINENFKVVFSDLFNGGTADIVLDDQEDVLTCGIDIRAQPPGKRLQSLSLLSGGERCLTAIALLFAILQLRPSPFCVLDEVEAALDDVNVNRFTDFVRRYTAKSQFILVTHRKGTMEACDRMYGVTMQERGISKILSMRLGDS
jgi:chromosome segregation protein